MKRVAAEKLLNHFEVAAYNHDALGSIPVHSDDPEEQHAIDVTRRAYKTDYTRTRNRLLKALENSNA